MVPWSFLRSEIVQRPGRALLTLLSVAIGVATVLAVSVAISTTRRAFREMYQTVAGRAALEVRADGDANFDLRILNDVAAAPGVKTAVPVLQCHSVLFSRPQRVQLMVLGIVPQLEPLVRDYVFAAGGDFPRGNEILLEAGFARSVGRNVGDEVLLLTRRGPHYFRLVGLLAPQGAAAFQGGSIVFMPLNTAQYWFRAPDEVNTIDVVLDDGAAEERVARDVAARLPQGFSVLPPSTRTELAREMLFLSEQGLRMAAVLSMVVAGFIIMNSLWMSVSERRRRLATLRTIGATRAQIFRLIVREGVLLGVIGTALGIGAGVGGAALLIGVMESMFQTALPAFQFDLVSVLIAAVLGVALSLTAVLLPARAAMRVSPLEGMRPVPEETSVQTSRRAVWIAGGLTLIATAGSVLIAQGVIPPPATPVFVVSALVGMSLLMPHWLSLVVRSLAAIFEHSGVNALLACRQILRQHTRSSLTAGVLFVAVVMSVGMGNSVMSNTQDVKDWVGRAVIGDFIVRSTRMIDLSTGDSPAIPEELQQQVGAVAGVRSVEPWTFGHTKAGELSVMVVARSFPAAAPLSLDLYQGDPDEVRRRLDAGEIVVSTVVAQRLGKGVGDTITLATAHGPQPMRIAGTCDDYIMGGTVIYVQSRIAQQQLGLQGVHALLIRVAPEQRSAAEATLRKLAEDNGLLLQSTAELARAIDGLMAGVNTSLWAMLLVGFVVASLGLVNTLTMNVVEQTRELGLMRMVGMTRLQVGRYVLSQAAVLGVVGVLPGAAAGQLTAYIINRVSGPVLGHPIAFQSWPQLVVGCVVFGLALSVAAACLPAWRAARLRVGQAIQYE